MAEVLYAQSELKSIKSPSLYHMDCPHHKLILVERGSEPLGRTFY